MGSGSRLGSVGRYGSDTPRPPSRLVDKDKKLKEVYENENNEPLNQKLLLDNKDSPERGRGDARLSRPAARVHRSKRSSVFSSGESATDSLGSTLEDVRLVPLEKTLQCINQNTHL